MSIFHLPAIQAALQESGLDGWLLYDFRGINPLARRILNLPADAVGSRRWVYGIPATGAPLKLVHRIEDSALDALPGEKQIYLPWQEFEAGLAEFCRGKRKIAMEYSPGGGNPYVSRVDAGTIELIRSFDVEVVSSGNLIQLFEATLTDQQIEQHLQAAVVTNSAYDITWKWIADRVRTEGGVTENEVESRIMRHFAEFGLTTYHPPIVAKNEHSGLPHYSTGTGSDTVIKEGDFVLIDLWAKLDQPGAVYSDLTRVGFVGTSVPQKYTTIFDIVAAARDEGVSKVREAFAAGRPVAGAEVDDAVRKVIVDAGYGAFFTHRTGHNIAEETHGSGAHIDNLETREDRCLLPRTCFSIEPGVYLPEFGVRLEIDVLIDGQGQVHVTGGPLQTEVLPVLRDY